MADAVFLIGIDLGTTNSACASVDTRRPEAPADVFQILQLIDPFTIRPRPVLPSFLYFGDAHEIESGAFALPWNARPDAIAGVLARERGAIAPAHQISSAKSWLAHPGVDRRAAILPSISAETGPRMSPVEASARCLAHIRDAWNETIAAGDDRLRLERQTIVLTVPASFDDEARELTVEAARSAALSRLTLIEEPIAAFYAWMAEHHVTEAETVFRDEQIALVCDVGGGTTDFSLIRIRLNAAAGPAFERIAIGDHLLLGGDNVDVALAALAERRMLDTRPDLRLAITQRSALRRLCSAAKERMLAPAPPDRVAITILGAGRSVVGEAITTELVREDVERTIADFLPITAPDELATPHNRRAGLRELGLPYETDPAITRHLAAFLSRSASALPAAHRAVAAIGGNHLVRPDLLLFNGGFFTPQVARERVAEAVASWFGEPPRLLTTSNLEAAVAIGAASYARLRAGIGVGPAEAGRPVRQPGPRVPFALVKAGSGRAYYVGLRAPHEGETTPAVCVLSRGTDEGTVTRIEHPFTVATNRPISFSLFSSTIGSDPPGNIVSLDPQTVHQHAPLVTVLRYGRKSRQVELPIHLSVSFTEVGTLELWCESQVSEHRWRLQFQLREPSTPPAADGPEASASAAAEPEANGTAEALVADVAVASGEHAIRCVFESPHGEVTAQNLVAHLEQLLGYAKTAWPIGVIRRFADVLIEVAEGRRRSQPLEGRWLNLFGFCLRPGFGAAKDPWRVIEARKIYSGGLAYGSAIQNRVEWLVLWQRAAGGFSAGQQRELAQRVMSDLGLTGKRTGRFNPQIQRESWRLLASLERLDATLRTTVGNELIARIRRDADNASFLWAIARLGARVPLYGPLSSVVPPADAGRWLDLLIGIKRPTPEVAEAIVQIGALTGDPLRELDEAIIARARQRVRDAGTDDESARPLYEVVAASRADANRVFGEPLPNGLRLLTP